MTFVKLKSRVRQILKRPAREIHTKTFPTRSEAMRHEKWLKSGHGREFIKSYK